MTARYELAPATRMLWRAADVVQFEMGDRGVVVEGLTTRAARGLTTAVGDEPDPEAAGALAQLAELGFIWPRDDREAQRRAAPSPRLAGELAALAARREIAAQTLHARRHAVVAVHGTGRVGPAIGAVLAASGVGKVVFSTETDVRAHSTMPAGLPPEAIGQRFAAAARAAVVRAAPDADVSRTDGVQRPDLALLAVSEPVTDDHRDALHAQGAPHLVVSVGSNHAVVGPLVLPGLTSCLRCADLHRGDRDDAWPQLSVQLSMVRRHGPSSEVAVASVAAGVAAMQALAFLDGEEPACLHGTLELHAPDWRLRRRSWPIHPRCGCCR